VMGIYGRPRGALPAVLSMLMGFGAWLTAFAVEHLDGVLAAPIFSTVTTIPADFWGLIFAVGGYRLGQAAGRFNDVPQRPPSAA
jgi:hypothetical protein